MKTLFLLLSTAIVATSASAKTLDVTVENVRSDKGTILVMATLPKIEKPIYGKADAKEGCVVVTVELPDEVTEAEVSLFHDEDGDYQMAMGDRGPEEGYAVKKCKLTDEKPAVKVNLLYPTTEAR